MKAGWRILPIAEFAKTGAGGTPNKASKEFYEGGEIPWLLSGEVANANITAARNFITPDGLKSSSAKLFPPNSVLVAMYGATAGEVGILRFEAATNQAVCAILPNPSYCTEYLYYFLLHSKPALVSQAVGNAQPNISQAKIKDLSVPLPPIEEQHQIVAVLDEAFEGLARARAHAEANLRDARELLYSMSQDALGRHETETITLGAVCEIYQPKTISSKDMVPNGKYVVYGANGPIGRYDNYNHELPQLLITCRGATCGSVNVSEPYCWITGNAMVVRPKTSKLNIEYLEVLFRYSMDFSEVITGAAQPQITRQSLAPVIMKVPSPEIQEEVVTAMRETSSRCGDLKASYRAKLESIDILRQSLLQKAFAGELT